MLSEAQIHEYQENGILIVRNVLQKNSVQKATEGANILVSQLADKLVAKGLLKDTFADEPLSTRLLKIAQAGCENEIPLLYRAQLHLPEFFPLFSDPQLLSCVRQLLPNARSLRIYPNYSMRPKLPDYAIHDVVWHQDSGLHSDGKPSIQPPEKREAAFGTHVKVNCWTPLVEANENNGAMFMVPGSHKLGALKHVISHRYRKEEDDTEGVSYGRYAACVDPSIMAEHNMESKKIVAPCGPGDVVFFSNLTVHRGGFNKSSGVRWSFDWRYQDTTQPTYRKEDGHVMWSMDESVPAVKTAEEWAKLSLS